MTSEVSAKYRWTIDELLAAMRAHYRAAYPRIVRMLWLGAGGMTLIAGIVSAMQVGVSRAVLPLAVGATLLLQFTVIQPLVLRFQFRKRPDRDSEVAYRFTSDMIFSSNWGGKSEFRWDALAKVVQLRDGLLFYPNSTIFNWVPNHAFQDSAELEQVVRWAEQGARVFKRKESR